MRVRSSRKKSSRLFVISIASMIVSGCVMPRFFEPRNIVCWTAEGAARVVSSTFAKKEIKNLIVTDGQSTADFQTVGHLTNPKMTRTKYEAGANGLGPSLAGVKVRELIQYSLVWRRGEYRVTKDGELEDFDGWFPYGEVFKDLGNNWAGHWQVEFYVKGKLYGAVPFTLGNRGEWEVSVLKAKDALRRGDRVLAEEHLRRARRNDPGLLWNVELAHLK